MKRCERLTQASFRLKQQLEKAQDRYQIADKISQQLMKERSDKDTNYEKAKYEALVQQQNAKRLAQALQQIRNQAEIEQSKYET